MSRTRAICRGILDEHLRRRCRARSTLPAMRCASRRAAAPCCRGCADTDVDAMIVKADLALYKAKELGKNDWRLFEASMDEAFRSRQLMKAGRPARRDRDRLSARRLPADRLDLDDAHRPAARRSAGGSTANSARSRRRSFIPLAEEMGIISEISQFVLQTACAECARWPEQISVSRQPVGQGFPQPRRGRAGAPGAGQLRPGAAPPRSRGDRDGFARRQVADAAVYRRDASRSGCASRSTISAPAIRA